VADNTWLARCSMVAAVAMLILTVGACGGGDDGDDVTSAAGTTDRADKGTAFEIGWQEALRTAAENSLRPAPPGTRSQLEEAIYDMQLNFAADNRFVVCGQLTEAGQKELAALQGRRDFQGCKNVIAAASKQRRETNDKTAISEVLSLHIDDDHAVAEIQDPDGARRLVPFVREGITNWGATSFSYIDPDAVESPPLGPGRDMGDPRAGEHEAVRESVYDVQAGFPRGDGRGVCSELTTSGRREVMVAVGGDATCPEAVAAVAREAARDGFQPRSSKIVTVDVVGRRAVAVLRDRWDRGKPNYRVPLIKEGGRWRLPSITLVEPIDLEPPAQGKPIQVDLGDPRTTDPKRQIREALTDVQADFAAGIATSICSDLSAPARRELLALARPGRRNCPNVIFDLVTWNRKAGIKPRYSRILSMKIARSRARVRVADPSRPPYEVPLVRTSSRSWALESLAHVEPIAAAMAHLRRLRAIRRGSS
jgi:hypothetical protein